MKQRIREAEHQDRERIEELYRILIPDDNEIMVLNERIDEFQRDPNQFLFVYEVAGRVEGTVLLSFCLDAMYGHRSFAVIENVIVDPNAWGTGIGKALFNHVVYCCRERDCKELLLMSNTRRTEAHIFFERQGFSHVAKGFKRFLE